jgi:DNA-binding NtrC family response regulator
VLVADDNAVNLKVACAMLLKLGYEVRTASDGREAVEAVAHAAAHRERLDAILMDVNMPDVDGLQRVVAAQVFDVAHFQPALLHGRITVRQVRQLAVREHVAVDELAAAVGHARCRRRTW